MSLPMRLESMTLEEKLQTMEEIWDDLCHKNADMASPDWHGGMLAEREKTLQSGDEKFLDWDVAKKRIKTKIK